ncbi:MAG: TonB-dependent receptor [Cytophagaceae bacterium]|nr:TonB-dependent receptor [Cytophagaceae bacterium]MDW8455765.1 TonB-dependent receptor [Cytophagaceae bacterium]
MKTTIQTVASCCWFSLICQQMLSQHVLLSGVVRDKSSGHPVPKCSVYFKNSADTSLTDTEGRFTIPYPFDSSDVVFLIIEHPDYRKDSLLYSLKKQAINIFLKPLYTTTDEVVISGTMREVSKLDSPVPVEVYNSTYFKKNPTPNVFESLTMINGVQPQLNCNVCNTGDIHINGMEGPYTMILIDGMPIVSSLSTVYGLSGIPNSLVKRIEIVKGPASTLYGSEAVAGLVNIITRDPSNSPLLKIDASTTTWNEYNADISGKYKIGKIQALTGANAFLYNTIHDKNADNFTDVTLQKRFSLFKKFELSKTNSLALRYVYENRWGGQTQWTPLWKGSDSIYGETVTTNRTELIGKYILPASKKKFRLEYSYNIHHQDSYYGTTKFLANQHTAFAQLLWNSSSKKHDILVGCPFRFIHYDDNTPATRSSDSMFYVNKPAVTTLPAIFIQDEWKISPHFVSLAGFRYDHHNEHGSIYTPRLSFKYKPHSLHTLRLSGGNGYRVVNLFTEDHAALTGARQVIIAEKLKPEKSWNTNLNYTGQLNYQAGFLIFDANFFYTYFTNKIFGDFERNPFQIIYENLNGYAISKGVSLNLDFSFINSLKINAGITYMQVYQTEQDSMGTPKKTEQLFAPRFSGTYAVSYTIPKAKITVDLTGLFKGPMRLPVLPNDFRPQYSPWFTLLNLQLTKKIYKNIEMYAGLKNILDFVPRHPIMRPFDPFDKNINDPVTNPHLYTFDTSYNYAPLQGIRGFAGLRWEL